MELLSLAETLGLDPDRILKGLKGKTESQGGLSVKDLKVIAETLDVTGKTRKDLEQVINEILVVPEDAPTTKSTLQSKPEVETKIPKLSKTQINRDLVDAVFTRDVEKVKTLLDVGANVNASKGQAVIIAVESGNPEILKLLIASGANQRLIEQALLIAADLGFHKVVEVLLNGTDITQKTKDKALYFAVMNSSLYIAQLLLEHGANIQANNKKILFELINTIPDDFITERLKFVLATGGDVHLQDEKILLVAVIQNKRNAVMLLLEYGAVVTKNIIRKASSEEMHDLLLHPENYVNFWETEGHIKGV